MTKPSRDKRIADLNDKWRKTLVSGGVLDSSLPRAISAAGLAVTHQPCCHRRCRVAQSIRHYLVTARTSH
jgi:hypothetical protein